MNSSTMVDSVAQALVGFERLPVMFLFVIVVSSAGPFSTTTPERMKNWMDIAFAGKQWTFSQRVRLEWLRNVLPESG